MNKLDHMRQGSRTLHEFITDFELTVALASYEDETFGPLLCHWFITKVNSCLANRLYDAGTSQTKYTELRDKAVQLEALQQQRDYERRTFHNTG